MGETSEIGIRTAAAEDAEVVVRIYLDSWNEGFGDRMRTREVDANLTCRWRTDLMQPTHRWWVAKRDGTIVGFAGIGPSRDPVDPSIGELDTIAIDPGHWRTGVGRPLMSLAVRYLVSDGYAKAVVWTLARYRQGAGFYLATGWSLTGAVRSDGGQVCYGRQLGKP